jgi:hypothetical protein
MNRYKASNGMIFTCKETPPQGVVDQLAKITAEQFPEAKPEELEIRGAEGGIYSIGTAHGGVGICLGTGFHVAAIPLPEEPGTPCECNGKLGRMITCKPGGLREQFNSFLRPGEALFRRDHLDTACVGLAAPGNSFCIDDGDTLVRDSEGRLHLVTREETRPSCREIAEMEDELERACRANYIGRPCREIAEMEDEFFAMCGFPPYATRVPYTAREIADLQHKVVTAECEKKAIREEFRTLLHDASFKSDEQKKQIQELLNEKTKLKTETENQRLRLRWQEQELLSCHAEIAAFKHAEIRNAGTMAIAYRDKRVAELEAANKKLAEAAAQPSPVPPASAWPTNRNAAIRHLRTALGYGEVTLSDEALIDLVADIVTKYKNLATKPSATPAGKWDPDDTAMLTWVDGHPAEARQVFEMWWKYRNGGFIPMTLRSLLGHEWFNSLSDEERARIRQEVK